MTLELDQWDIELGEGWEGGDSNRYWHNFTNGTLFIEMVGAGNTYRQDGWIVITHRDQGQYTDKLEIRNGQVGAHADWERQDHSNIECWRLGGEAAPRGIIHIERDGDGEPTVIVMPSGIRMRQSLQIRRVTRTVEATPEVTPTPDATPTAAPDIATDMVLNHVERRDTTWRPLTGHEPYWQLFRDDNNVRVYVRRHGNQSSTDLLHVSSGDDTSLMIDANGTVRGSHGGWQLNTQYSRGNMDYWVCPGEANGRRRASVEIDWTSAERTHIRNIRVWGTRSGDPLWFDAPQQEAIIPQQSTTTESSDTMTTTYTPPATIDQYQRAFERLNTMLEAEARRRDWCSDYETFVDTFNEASPAVKLNGRAREYRGDMSISFNFEAGRNGESREGMNVVVDAVRELLGRFGTLQDVSVSGAVNHR